MLFVLVGPSYVGKKTSMAHFIKLYSFNSIIPYTTKPHERRKGEVEGIQYHYISEDLEKDIVNEDFIHDTPFNYDGYNDNVIYAYRKIDITNAIESYSNFIIHASVHNAINIYDEYHNIPEYKGQLYIIFLDYSVSPSTDKFDRIFRSKYPDPINGDNDENFLRRYYHAKKEHDTYINNKKKFDIQIADEHIHNICVKLENYILPKLTVMPTSPDKIPGPLSDKDLIYMAFKRKTEKLMVKVNNKEITEVSAFKDLLCGCTMQISLSSHIRKMKKRKMFNLIDMILEEGKIEEILTNLYPEKSIRTGYLMKPNETILCTSNEYIEVPKDVFAVVSSKFSYTQLGLSIELGTSIIQAGHKGKVHFQIKNNSNNYIWVYPGIFVAQLIFFRTVQPSSESYNSSENNHSYDIESNPPISKFRVNNKYLNCNQHKKNSVIIEIFRMIEDTLTEKIVGIILTCIIGTGGIVLLRDHLKPVYNILRDIKNVMTGGSLLFSQILAIAVIVFIIEILFGIMGHLFVWIGSEIKSMIFGITRNFNQTEDEE